MINASSISRVLNRKFGHGAFTTRNGDVPGAVIVLGEGMPVRAAAEYLNYLGCPAKPTSNPNAVRLG